MLRETWIFEVWHIRFGGETGLYQQVNDEQFIGYSANNSVCIMNTWMRYNLKVMD